VNPGFWRGRRVLVTGHTGFKGSWLTSWLQMLGAEVSGFSLPDDIRDLAALRAAMQQAVPEIVFHLAAQALVRASYRDPVATYTTNVTGTMNVLESIRSTPSVRVAVMVTSDKCYANSGTGHPFREDDPLGGSDPYSSSKAAAELVIAAYRSSYFAGPDATRIISVRAGNVIGGGDWGEDRLVPDLVRAFQRGVPAEIRYPDATRPWQFVLDALHGYLLVAERGFVEDLPSAFNFGPEGEASRSVAWVADRFVREWDGATAWVAPGSAHPAEAQTLAVDSTRAREVLRWHPLLSLEEALVWTADVYRHGQSRSREQLTRFTEIAQA
jgi:CDP-glucose 4,6-dehydratase